MASSKLSTIIRALVRTFIRDFAEESVVPRLGKPVLADELLALLTGDPNQYVQTPMIDGLEVFEIAVAEPGARKRRVRYVLLSFDFWPQVSNVITTIVVRNLSPPDPVVTTTILNKRAAECASSPIVGISVDKSGLASCRFSFTGEHAGGRGSGAVSPSDTWPPTFRFIAVVSEEEEE